jgi:outer membrane protein insertion porin family
VAYIIERNEAPFFERFYTGGRRFRGFEFRGIGPIGIAANTGLAGDDHVGGDFLLFLGGEYNFPIYEKMVRGVIFIDTGTLDHDINMNSYRITVGAGVRIALPAFGPVPIAIDFGIPIKDVDGDEDQLISFDVAFPF